MSTFKETDAKSNIIGTVMATSRGVGYIEHPDPENEPQLAEDQDIEIPPEAMSTALNGDTVEVVLLPKKEGERLQAKVVEVLERRKDTYVGTISKEGNVFFLLPDDRRMYIDIFIDIRAGKKPKDGYKAVVELIDWRDPEKNPRGKIVDLLGPKGEHEVEMKAIMADKGIDFDFPPKVEQEAKEIQSKKGEHVTKALEERRDLRDVTTFTVDPDDAKDFDDALSVKKLDNGNFEIGVHIADVSHYVRPGSDIDKEARERAFSVYLVDRTIPMLPEVLSNDLCSLNPEEDKLAFSGIFTMTPSGSIKDRWFGRTVIKSDKRFTYGDAQAVLDAREGDFYNELQILDNTAKVLRRMRMSEGAVNFSSDEIKFELDEEGKPVNVYRKERFDTHKMIEEFMLLCNREVAKEIYRMSDEEDRDHLFLYRVHDLPDREKLEELAVFVRALGYDFTLEEGEKISGQDINTLLKLAEGKAEEGLINTALIRSMAKAIYSTKQEGHFGLAFEYYTHFTSPIRRYPDLVVHRLLFKHLNGERIPKDEFAQYQAIAKEASEREREVLDAERESIKYKQVEYLKDHVGDEFNGVITGVSKYGAYVEEGETLAQGMVNVMTMDDDYYNLEEKSYSLVGRDTGNRYTIGDEVRVKLLKADMEQKQLDFAFAEK